MKRKYEVNSHENFSHDHIKSVGYDWDFAANPKIKPKRPLRIYLPETTEEIAEVLKEADGLGLKVNVRSKGHSSNNLVLGDRKTAVLWTEFLRRTGGEDGDEEQIENVDLATSSVWIWAGAVLAEVDAQLEKQGYGLPVIGDHNHITAGGFASVGGVSPASNKYGMFVDNIDEIEWVDRQGNNIRRCNKDKEPADFFALLGGTGQHGVIARLRCKVIEGVKTRTILKNRRKISRKLEEFVELSAQRIKNPGKAKMERGLWLDFPLLGTRSLKVGQYSGYEETPETGLKSLYDRVIHGFLHGLGYLAGRAWGFFDPILQAIGIVGVICAPRYASIKNIESFADKVLDSSVGDPYRMLIVFAPVERYTEMFYALHDLCLEFRHRGCLSFIALYVKGINSRYLSSAFGGKDIPGCEILLYLGVKRDRMSDRDLEEMVGRIDDLCIKKGALRYMHTRTVAREDPRRSSIDPNARIAAATREVPVSEAG